ncbi:DedA family protein [Azospirillum sp. RWY-5-1]|uniref:DedA family protein n=1 Tax=Azospirillum oleiclasticum TaxID=2735135 RepID=A0ABX2TAX3_9PROT|nr:YqaA family protein [Azospirillum oleiclasticum]NYZ14013.1 DedA family protein [Azospirillum oleiclasticum]NYZ21497.1 DedA family protein [Azospirillum oleiclasticum]
MLRPLYNWILRRSARPDAVWWMAGVSFAESSFFPLPPDIMLIPMCLAEPKKLWRYTNICALASLFGGILGYAIGFFLFDSVGRLLFDLYGLWDAYYGFQHSFNTVGPWLLVLKGVTPIPYKLLAITAGIAKMDIVIFLLCSVVARFSRYYIIAVLLHFYGPQVQRIIEKRLMLVTTLLVVVVVGGLLSFKLV